MDSCKVGMHYTTIGLMRSDLERRDIIKHFETHIGKDGKVQSATKQVVESTTQPALIDEPLPEPVMPPPWDSKIIIYTGTWERIGKIYETAKITNHCRYLRNRGNRQ